LWEEAIKLLEELIEETLLPSIISFNSAINAISKCGCRNWSLSLVFLDTMQQMGLQPSIATFGALIGQEGSKWRSVSQLLRVMTTNHLRQGSTTHHRHLFICLLEGWHVCMKMIENAEKTVIDCWGRTVGLGQAEPDQCKHRYHVLF
jgi:hypothetical protein